MPVKHKKKPWNKNQNFVLNIFCQGYSIFPERPYQPSLLFSTNPPLICFNTMTGNPLSTLIIRGKPSIRKNIFWSDFFCVSVFFWLDSEVYYFNLNQTYCEILQIDWPSFSRWRSYQVSDAHDGRFCTNDAYLIEYICSEISKRFRASLETITHDLRYLLRFRC